MPNCIAQSKCPKCGYMSWQLACPSCKTKTIIYKTCKKCGRLVWNDNIIVKPDGRSTQCRHCQYITCNEYRKLKRSKENG